MQIAKSFDAVTMRKMAHSALLLIAGTMLAFLSDNMLSLLVAGGIPTEYMPFAVSLCTWLVNTAREWLKGESKHKQ